MLTVKVPREISTDEDIDEDIENFDENTSIQGR